MARVVLHNMLFLYGLAITFSLLPPSVYCFHPKVLTNVFKSLSDISWSWAPAGATWYGPPNGAGTDGGACGYMSAVGEPPFNSKISAGGPFFVKCTENAACSGEKVTVVITDECPGGPCLAEPVHFDLSGAAFGAMAKSGREDQLRNVSVMNIQYRRQVVKCKYPGVKIAFRVDPGSNPWYFSTAVQFVNGDGDLTAVEVQEDSSKQWLPRQRLWGAVWKLNSGNPLNGPFSIKLTTPSKMTLVAKNVIPAGWVPGRIYHSKVNF
ncbi:RlpA-like protein, double-psi beta-barrel domain [Dillenia turbinata]|uniref:RlpA-like protein, double-psi beta-barrel domain n=1 Tax=Dillenia turbinata TaxID=194707 RepID=A0AAN8UKL6_9MAGN